MSGGSRIGGAFSPVGAEAIYDARYLQISNNLSDVGTVATARTNLGLGSGNSPAFTGLSLSGLTASELVATDVSKNLVSLAVATYPSLTELSYVKGVTSAIQTQLGLKAPLASPTFTTQIISPLIIGGTATTADLSLQTTSGVGATGADMHFLVGNNGATEAMTILNSGNVGIGTTGPGRKLSLFQGTGGVHTSYQSTATGVTTGDGLLVGIDVSDNAFMWNYENLDLYFGTNNTQQVTIKNTGNVGIGTTAPDANLDVDGAARTVTAVSQRAFINNTNAITTNTGATAVYGLTIDEPNITTGTVQATNSASLYISGAATEAVNNYALWVDAGLTRLDGTLQLGLAGTVTGVMNFQGITSGVVTIQPASVAGTYTLTLPALGSAATVAVIDVQQIFSATHILSSGLKVGGTADNQTLNDASTGTGTVTLYIGNNTINVTAPSDRRLKRNELLYDGSVMASIRRLPFKTYYFQDEQERTFGLIAQDVQQILPSYVFARSDDYLQIDYTKMMPMVLRGLQETDDEITRLKARVAELGERISMVWR